MEVTSTTYMAFLLSTGLRRLRIVQDSRRQYESGYRQGLDYYRPIRTGVIAVLREESTIADLWAIVEAADNKRENFAAVVNGFEVWFAKRGIVWGSRPSSHYWKHGELKVNVNPEVRMNVDGEPYRVKLYFRDAAVTQPGANLVVHLHELAGFDTDNVGVLDVRNAKLFTKKRSSEDYAKVLRAEALSFASMWHAVGQQVRELPGDAIS